MEIISTKIIISGLLLFSVLVVNELLNAHATGTYSYLTQ